jgi:hypothetical protein
MIFVGEGQIFDPDSNTLTVYEHAARPIVLKALEGFHGIDLPKSDRSDVCLHSAHVGL